jgi:hypothetical protein
MKDYSMSPIENGFANLYQDRLLQNTIGESKHAEEFLKFRNEIFNGIHDSILIDKNPLAVIQNIFNDPYKQRYCYGNPKKFTILLLFSMEQLPKCIEIDSMMRYHESIVFDRETHFDSVIRDNIMFDIDINRADFLFSILSYDTVAILEIFNVFETWISCLHDETLFNYYVEKIYLYKIKPLITSPGIIDAVPQKQDQHKWAMDVSICFEKDTPKCACGDLNAVIAHHKKLCYSKWTTPAK